MINDSGFATLTMSIVVMIGVVCTRSLWNLDTRKNL